jgi:hypothetical protein
MGYGYEVKGINDRKVNAAKNMIQLSSKTALPGAILVNDLPFCEFAFSLEMEKFDIHSYQYDTSLNGFRG